ncbi:hypothetical protein [Bacillus sp. UNC438CL73TsuS30]|uniref:hypothetical protein n=1 Tax=Bacillus sp. UNC438CL73TsuS30 TaxID=1340434 RepID=UPI0004789A0C|nr:hypothetical protein [Bacillus sp. UNC438CL73TsuS30]
MDKTVIFNVFDFVSFHFCKALLNNGVEVNGVVLDKSQKEPYLDEKRLEVGRNANFNEVSLTEWAVRNDEPISKTNVIISLYDLYMLHKENLLENKSVTKPILQYVNEREGKDLNIILLPSQLAASSKFSNTLNTFNDFLTKMNIPVDETQFFYLPTIYGPWQPETFLFQRKILTNLNRNVQGQGGREDRTDALFIDDALDAMLEIIKSKKPGSYFFESGKKDYWKLCAEYLQIDGKPLDSEFSGNIVGNRKIVRVPIKSVTAIDDSFSKQIDHIQQLYSNIL